LSKEDKSFLFVALGIRQLADIFSLNARVHKKGSKTLTE